MQTNYTNMHRSQSLSVLESQLDDTRERLRCLIRQEAEHYLCEDYLQGMCHLQSSHDNRKAQSSLAVEECARIVSDLAFSSSADDSMPTYPSSVCVKDFADSQVRAPFIGETKSAVGPNLVGFWRQQMLDWSHLVLDSFGIDRDVAAVAFNVLDRYVAKETQSNIPITREDFQLFSMTALFIAVKLLESYPRKLSADSLVGMSRGFYATEDILQTEQEILKSLGFFLNPTTTIGFCRLFWDMFPLAVSFQFQLTCHSIAEIALKDTFFLARKPSTVGLAAVMHASRLEGHADSVRETFLSDLRGTISVGDNDDFNAVYQRVRLLSEAQSPSF